MLIDTLNDCIIDMNTVMELKTASMDSKNQAIANHKFKQLVCKLKTMTEEVYWSVQNSDFRPSTQSITLLKGFINACDKVVQSGMATKSTTDYITGESKGLYETLEREWGDYFEKATSSILNLLKMVGNILPDGNTARYAANMIQKASGWNHSAENYKYLEKGLADAEKLIDELNLNNNPEVLDFLRLVSEGNATVLNLTDEILEWIRKENLAGKIRVCF